jgi:hypothetical protein
VTEPIGDRRILQTLPGGGFGYSLIDDAVRIEARYLRRQSGLLHAEVDVICDWAGAKRHQGSLSCADLNLSSQAARKALAKYCAERAGTKPADFDWPGVLDAACIEIIRASRAQNDVRALDDAPPKQSQDFDICGLKIPADASSMLIAHGDSMKSLLLLWILGTLAQRGIPVLYLDWEWTASRHKQRKDRLFGTERLDGLRYQRCSAPLIYQCDAVRRYCDTEHIGFLGVDSVGMACEGKLNDDDTARSFHQALASLPPSLTVAHVPKNSANAETTKHETGNPMGPFGSVFFSNLCRSTWLVKKQESSTADLLSVGLFPQKQNDGARTRPVGLEVAFNPQHIDVRPVDLVTVEGLANRLPLAQRMRHLLQQGPPLTAAQIASELDVPANSIFHTAKRNAQVFTKIENAPDGIQRIALVTRDGQAV